MTPAEGCGRPSARARRLRRAPHVATMAMRSISREAFALMKQVSNVFCRLAQNVPEGLDRAAPTPEAVAAALLAEFTPADRKSTRLNSSHIPLSRMPSSA